MHRLPGTDVAEREASEWITRLNADHVADQDRAHFETWRRASPRNARAYDELAASYGRFVAASPLVRAVSFGYSMKEATQPRRSHWRITLAAASAVGVALLVWWYRVQLLPDTRFQTAIGEHASVSLPDGSALELNSNSLARVEYSRQARIIRLERGEAFFKVQHDTQRPFWVVAGGSWVRAVGTAFNVYLRPADVQVTVSEGMVKVAAIRESGNRTPSDRVLSGMAASIVTAGEQVQLRGAKAQLRALAPTELTRFVAWRSGTLNFENQPLGRVVDELSRYTTMKIAIDEPSLRDFPVGGTFEANSEGVEALLILLQEGFGLEVERVGNERATIERRTATPAPK